VIGGSSAGVWRVLWACLKLVLLLPLLVCAWILDWLSARWSRLKSY